MFFVSARAGRTAVIVIALSAAGLCALHAMDAKADPPAVDDSSACAEGRALFAAKLAYLEARIAPEPSQGEAWRRFADAMRTAGEDLDRSCTQDAPRTCSVNAGDRLKRMEKHAAAMRAMFAAMADAYEAIAPNLSAAQRDILSRNIVPAPPFPPFPPPGPSLQPYPGALALSCGEGATALHDWAAPGDAPPL